MSSYLTSASLSAYETTSALTTTLANYVTSSSLTTTLANYVTASSLTTTLGSYATTASLSGYETTSALTTTLGSYATTAAMTSAISASAGDSAAYTGTSTLLSSGTGMNQGLAVLCNYTSGLYYIGIWQNGDQYYYPTTYYLLFKYFNTNNNFSGVCSGAFTTIYAGGAPYFTFRVYSSSSSYTSVSTFTEGEANKVDFTAGYDFKVVATTGTSVNVQVRRIL